MAFFASAYPRNRGNRSGVLRVSGVDLRGIVHVCE